MHSFLFSGRTFGRLFNLSVSLSALLHHSLHDSLLGPTFFRLQLNSSFPHLLLVVFCCCAPSCHRNDHISLRTQSHVNHFFCLSNVCSPFFLQFPPPSPSHLSCHGLSECLSLSALHPFLPSDPTCDSRRPDFRLHVAVRSGEAIIGKSGKSETLSLFPALSAASLSVSLCSDSICEKGPKDEGTAESISIDSLFVHLLPDCHLSYFSFGLVLRRLLFFASCTMLFGLLLQSCNAHNVAERGRYREGKMQCTGRW